MPPTALGVFAWYAPNVSALANVWRTYGALVFAGQRTQQQIECGDVRNHRDRHVDDRDGEGGSQLPRHRGKADLNGVVVVDEQVSYSCEIECDGEKRKARTCPYCEKRQDGHRSGCKVPIGGTWRQDKPLQLQTSSATRATRRRNAFVVLGVASDRMARGDVRRLWTGRLCG